MYDNSKWKQDLMRSNSAFISIVWPTIQTKCGGGRILMVEPDDSGVDFELDVTCGIDALQITETGCRGIAVRIQFCDRNWRSFTIRKCRTSLAKTEYEKRKTQIDKNAGYIYPYLTCQAYIKGETLLGCGVAITKNLYATPMNKINHTTNADFYIVNFDDVLDCYEYLIYI